MPTESSILPCVFLAFANPRNDLDRLADEHLSIRSSLEKAEKEGLCEFIERFNLNISTLINVFQDSRLANRISIFHFGGHAGDFELILNNSKIEGHSFNRFLLEIPSLRLVFLNGCSTFQQAQDLLKLGIPAVIATSQKIPDDVAKEFASRFYNGLAEGLSINNSFKQAKLAILSSSTDNIKISQALSDPRKPKKELEILWDLYYTNEDSYNWKLSDEINNPYFGLPKPLNYLLPNAPYISLQPYTEKESLIFWGRGKEIKDLFTKVMDENVNPVILLYGQTGVGKSSLLDAGLIPRLKAVSNVFYTRRAPDIGLIKTLLKSLDIHSDNLLDFILSLNALAESTKKGIVIIIDQLEEVFTKPIKEYNSELKDFFSLLSKIIYSKDLNNVKIILGYRKEYHAEIESESTKINIPFSAYFLHPLKRDNLVEIINGSNLSATTRNQYCITLEKDLDEQIADDLSKDIDSPVAPILQILLTKLWEKSTLENNSRFFSKKTYYNLKDNGLALGDFINEQIIEISEWNSDIVESGLLLDILYFHTTPLGTSASHELESILDRYDNGSFIKKIIQKCKDCYLLSEDKDSGQYISLAHDTLGPIIRAMFESSVKDGQKATRILKNQETYLINDQDITVLNTRDLETVEKGSKGMRKWNDREIELVIKSQKERSWAIRQKKIRNIVLGCTVIGISILSIISLIYWQQSKKQASIAYAQQKAAQSRVLADQPLQFLTAAQFALDGINQYNSLETNQAARYILSKMLSPVSTFSYPNSLNGVEKIVFSNDNCFLAASSRGYIKIFNVKTGKIIKTFSINDKFDHLANDLKFSNNNRFLGYASDRDVWLWEWKTNKRPVIIDASNHSTFNSNSNYVACVSNAFDNKLAFRKALLKDGLIKSIEDSIIRKKDGLYINKSLIPEEKFKKYQQYFQGDDNNNTLRIYDVYTGIEKYKFHHDSWIVDAEFSPIDPLLCAVGYEDGDVVLYKLKESRPFFTFQGKGKVMDIEFDCTGNYIAVAHDNGIIEVFNVSSKQVTIQFAHYKSATEIHFSKNGKRILSQSKDGTTRVWNSETGQEISRHNLFENPTGIAFLKEGQYFASASYGDNVRLFDSSSGEEFGVVPMKSNINSICASPDGNYLATADDNANIVIWNVSVSDPFYIFKHREEVTSLQIDNNIIISSSDDGSVRCWDSKTGKEIYRIQHKYQLWRTPVYDLKLNMIASTSENVILKNRSDFNYSFNINLYRSYHDKYLFDQNGNLLSIDLNFDITELIGESPVLPNKTSYNEEVPIIYLNNSDSLLGGKLKPKTIKRKVTFKTIDEEQSRDWGGSGSGILGPIAIANNGKILVTAAWDMIWIWDTEKKELLSKISHGYIYNDNRLKFANINTLLFSFDGKLLLTETTGGILRCWNVENPKKPKLFSINKTISTLNFKLNVPSPFIVSKTMSNKLYLLNVPSFSKRDSITSKGSLDECYFNAKGDMCAVLSYGETKMIIVGEGAKDTDYFIEIWDLKKHKKMNQFTISSPVHAISFSSDNRNIAVAQQNALVSVWDLKTNKEVSRIAHKGSVKSVFFTKNDRIIVSTIGPTGRVKTNDYSNEILLSYWKQEDLSRLLIERIGSVASVR
ncbi:CHAT domain-containing protein [Flavobacterium sp. FlaQc-50]|jgi:WD40 repeat protein|uniref:nSTAND1 domain-containing NTPase n=1 Tax=unclassified Flavobacterium TaxID=196869 RepID=UPI00375725EA